MARQRASWGSNEDAGRGKRRIRYWADLGDGRGYRRVSETVYGSRRDADDVLAARRVEHSRDHAVPTVGNVWTACVLPWMDVRLENGSMSANSVRQFKSAWENHVRERWADVRLDDVYPADVQRWLLQKSHSTALQCRTVLSRVMERARFERWTQADPMAVRYELRPATRTVRRTDAYSMGELRELWRAFHGTTVEAAFLLMAFGGCRVGESLGPRVTDVAELRGCAVVAIDRTVGDSDGEVGADGDLKTSTSQRWAVVPGPMGRRLLEVASERAAMGAEWLTSDDGSTTMGKHALRWRIGVAEDAAGLRKLPPMTFRPSWQTTAKYTLRIEPLIVERLMGHVAPGVTGAHYDRPSVDDYVRPVAEAYAAHPFADDWDN